MGRLAILDHLKRVHEDWVELVGLFQIEVLMPADSYARSLGVSLG
jgi:hypothetical protein